MDGCVYIAHRGVEPALRLPEFALLKCYIVVSRKHFEAGCFYIALKGTYHLLITAYIGLRGTFYVVAISFTTL